MNRAQYLQQLDSIAQSLTEPAKLSLVTKVRNGIASIPESAFEGNAGPRLVARVINSAINESINAAVQKEYDLFMAEQRREAQSLVDSAKVVLELPQYEEPCQFDDAIALHAKRADDLRKQLTIVERRLDELVTARDSQLYSCIHDLEKHVEAQRLVNHHNLRAQQLEEQRLKAAEDAARARAQQSASASSPSEQPQSHSSPSAQPSASNSLPLFNGLPVPDLSFRSQ